MSDMEKIEARIEILERQQRNMQRDIDEIKMSMRSRLEECIRSIRELKSCQKYGRA